MTVLISPKMLMMKCPHGTHFKSLQFFCLTILRANYVRNSMKQFLHQNLYNMCEYLDRKGLIAYFARNYFWNPFSFGYGWKSWLTCKIDWFLNFLKSNLIEIQRIETATYSNKAYFPREHFLYFWEIKRFCKTL